MSDEITLADLDASVADLDVHQVGANLFRAATYAARLGYSDKDVMRFVAYLAFMDLEGKRELWPSAMSAVADMLRREQAAKAADKLARLRSGEESS